MKAPPSRKAFTLVEIVVAVSILLILALFVTKIIGATNTTINLSSRITNTDSDARLVFNRLSLDFGSLLKRADVDFWAGNPSAMNGNYLLLFLSGVASDNSDSPSGGNRNLSLVGYRVAASDDNPGANRAAMPCLLRAGRAVGWSTSGFVGLKSNGLPVRFSDTSGQVFPSALLPTVSSSSTADFDVLAPGVVKMVVGFQLRPDNASVTLEDGTPVANAQGQIVYSPPIQALTPAGGGTPVNYVDLSRISAIVAGLVVVDSASLKLLAPSQATAIAGRFAVPQENVLPVRAWKTTLNDLVSSLSPGIPLPALQSVHTYECAFPVVQRGETLP